MLGATTALTAAGLLIPGATQYFLPPNGGWGAQLLKVRRISQYVINRDAYVFRYDAGWDTPSGEAGQFCVDFPLNEFPGNILPYSRIAERILIDRMIADGGTPNSSALKLDLPKHAEFADYIYIDPYRLTA
jgi:hypothetical protein